MKCVLGVGYFEKEFELPDDPLCAVELVLQLLNEFPEVELDSPWICKLEDYEE